MSTWYETNEVLSSTAKLLKSIYAKYQSADASKFEYADYVCPAEPAKDFTLSSYEPVDPKSFVSEPPMYIDDKALDEELEKNFAQYTTEVLPPDWAQTYHYSIDDVLDEEKAKKLCQYVLVLDALNFCFWPLQGYEYEHLASSLRAAFVANPDRFSAKHLMNVTEHEVSTWLQNPAEFPLISHPSYPAPRLASNGLAIPLLSARTRALREIGAALDKHYDGLAYNMIKAANQSVLELLRIVTSIFPSFRDHMQYGGDQVFFYKRAQIFIGDIWGAFGGKGVGTFHDMHMLTCFADYRIPQLLRGLGVLKCSKDVDYKIEHKIEIPAGSEEELCIRAATVQAVEAIRMKMAKKGHTIHAFQLDWILWEAGEKLMKEDRIPPHHRTITTYY